MKLKKYVARKVVLQLADGSIAGVVASADRDKVVLVSALHYDSMGTGRPVDGEVHVPNDSITWAQVL